MPSMKEILAASNLALLGGEGKATPVIHATKKVVVRAPVTNKVVANVTNALVTNAKAPRKVKEVAGESARVLRWRAENAERYKATQRALMKKKRAEARAKAASGVPA